MTLAEWMALKGITDETLAADLRIDRSTVSRVRRGKLFPSSALIAALVEKSDGAISLQTFFEPPYPVPSADRAAE